MAAEGTTDRIFEAAREVLAVKGFDASIVDIVERAQVGMASLYRRWKSREA